MDEAVTEIGDLSVVGRVDPHQYDSFWDNRRDVPERVDLVLSA